MKQGSRWPWVLLMALATVLAITRPVPFADFAHTDRATYFQLMALDDAMEVHEAQPDRQEIQPLLDLLEQGTVRPWGRKEYVTWDSKNGIYLYRMTLYHEQDGRWVVDGDFQLRSDGAVFRSVWLGRWSLGQSEYRLKGCDLAAVDAELRHLLELD